MITLSSCSNNKEVNNWVRDNFEVQIVTSLPPIASIAQFIGWETLNVNNIIKPGFSPHTFDLKPSHLKQINNADLVITTWLNIDNFLDNISISTETLLLKNYVTLLEWEKHNHDDLEEEETHHHENESEDEHNQDIGHSETENIYYDPHLWLSLENWEKIAEIIKNKLIKIKPENKFLYENNFVLFKNKSQNIKNNFLEKIKNKKQNNFIVYHNAYNYLFEEINIDFNNILVLSETAGREPSVLEMREIVDSITQNNIKILFKEPQLDTKLIQTLSQKYGLEILKLDPLGKTTDANWYFETIESNLNNLLKIYE